MDTKGELGQYFTTDPGLKSKVVEFVLNAPKRALEPSAGRGDLVVSLVDKYPDCHVDMFEVDPSLSLNEGAKGHLVTADFMTAELGTGYETIIGNPPFVRTSGGNLYIDFVRKCVSLLTPGGELVFIVPSDFFKLTSSAKLLADMMSRGTFPHVHFPDNEHLFKGASIDVVVFRYCLDPCLPKTAMKNGSPVFVREKDGLVTFSKESNEVAATFGDKFSVHVGLVSGKESVFRNETLGNIEVLTGTRMREKYIMIAGFPSGETALDDYLVSHKQDLMSRRIRSFGENNWYEWGAPRNVSIIESQWGRDCIYLSNLTRHSEVAFRGKVEFFGGSLLMLLPRKDVDIDGVVNYMNSMPFKENFLYAGRFKIGHSQVSKCALPSSLAKTETTEH